MNGDVVFIGTGPLARLAAEALAVSGRTVRSVPASAHERAGEGFDEPDLCPEFYAPFDNASAVVTLLPDANAVIRAWKQALKHVDPGCLLIDCSFIGVTSARECHAMAAFASCHSIDAPATGSLADAASGDLSFWAGGSESAFLRARPLLQALGNSVVYCGRAGAGQAATACINLVAAAGVAGLSEALLLADRLGIERGVVLDSVARIPAKLRASAGWQSCPAPPDCCWGQAERQRVARDLAIVGGEVSRVGRKGGMLRAAEGVLHDGKSYGAERLKMPAHYSNNKPRRRKP